MKKRAMQPKTVGQKRENRCGHDGTLSPFRRVLLRKNGRLWPFLAIPFACVLYIGWVFSATWLLQWYFAALFGKLEISAANAAYAPGWAAWLWSNQGLLISAAVQFGAWGIARKIYQRHAKSTAGAPKMRSLAIGMGLGFSLAALPAGLFLLLDSVRIGSISSPCANWIPVLLAYAAACMAEEMLCRRLAYDLFARRAGRLCGAILSCAAMFTLCQGWALGGLGAINILLMGLVCCELYHDMGAFASLGLRISWSWASVLLFRFSGGSAAVAPWLELYSLSEEWLTGGANGLTGGLFMTLALLLMLFPSIKRAIQRAHGA